MKDGLRGRDASDEGRRFVATIDRPNGAMTMFVYMLANRRHGTLYLGVTNDLSRRIAEHRSGATIGFATRHGLARLVWYETYERPIDAVAREKALTKWRRAWKTKLVDASNPEWTDITPSLTM